MKMFLCTWKCRDRFSWFTYNAIRTEGGHYVVRVEVQINSEAPNVKVMLHMEAVKRVAKVALECL